MSSPAPAKKQKSTVYSLTWLRHVFDLFIPIAMLSPTSSLQLPDQQQCSSHGKSLEVYCDTCDKPICHLCTVKNHRDHECDAITDAFPRHQQLFVDGLIAAVQTLKSQEGGFLEQVEAARREIKATVQQQMQVSERQLMKELDQVSASTCLSMFGHRESIRLLFYRLEVPSEVNYYTQPVKVLKLMYTYSLTRQVTIERAT